MSARTTAEDLVLSIPHCISNGTSASQNDTTCVERVDNLFLAFSSTVVLIVLIAVIIGIVIVSLLTFHFRKRKMKRRKIQKAQEEYERDTCSPKEAKVKPAVRQCIMVRPSGPRTGLAAVAKNNGNNLTPAGEPVCAIENDSGENTTRQTRQGNDEHVLESVSVTS